MRNDRYVSDDVRSRVEQAITELQYVPNVLARSFWAGNDTAIGVAVPDISDPFFAAVTHHTSGRAGLPPASLSGTGGRQRTATASPVSSVRPAPCGTTTVSPRRAGSRAPASVRSSPAPPVTTRTANDGSQPLPR